jgi:hypothetical protein
MVSALRILRQLMVRQRFDMMLLFSVRSTYNYYL